MRRPSVLPDLARSRAGSRGLCPPGLRLVTCLEGAQDDAGLRVRDCVLPAVRHDVHDGLVAHFFRFSDPGLCIMRPSPGLYSPVYASMRRFIRARVLRFGELGEASCVLRLVALGPGILLLPPEHRLPGVRHVVVLVEVVATVNVAVVRVHKNLWPLEPVRHSLVIAAVDSEIERASQIRAEHLAENTALDVIQAQRVEVDLLSPVSDIGVEDSDAALDALAKYVVHSSAHPYPK